MRLNNSSPYAAPGYSSTPWSFRDHAECATGPDPDLWFDDDQSGPLAMANVEEAKECCRRCPVIDPCLHEALVRGEKHGVWGGLTTGERVGLRPFRRPDRREDGPDDAPQAAGAPHARTA